MADSVEWNVRLDEVPELRDVAEHLAQLGVRDVMIRPVEVDATFSGWAAVAILADGSSGDVNVITWALATRSSEAEARAAVTMLLRGVVDARVRTQKMYPWPDSASGVEVETGRRAAVVEILDEWWDRLSRRAADYEEAGRQHARERAAAERSAEIVASGFDPSDFGRWCNDVRAQRGRNGFTQKELAKRAGLTQSRVSELERGMWIPGMDMVVQISRLLAIPMPTTETCDIAD